MVSAAHQICAAAAAVVFCAAAFGQVYTEKIRGYKVHRQKIVVGSPSDSSARTGRDPAVKASKPGIAEVSITGATFSFDIVLNSPEQSGRIDLLSFYDFTVNGIPVEIEDYRHSFAFKKEPAKLPEPVRVFVPTHRLIHAAWLEMRDSKRQWEVSGRVFVFGRFRRLGFYHKRVVPIEVRFLIDNPF